MDIPIVHPTAIRFYLEKNGINPSDERAFTGKKGYTIPAVRTLSIV